MAGRYHWHIVWHYQSGLVRLAYTGSDNSSRTALLDQAIDCHTHNRAGLMQIDYPDRWFAVDSIRHKSGHCNSPDLIDF